MPVSLLRRFVKGESRTYYIRLETLDSVIVLDRLASGCLEIEDTGVSGRQNSTRSMRAKILRIGCVDLEL